jgi:hypothetical protein
MESATRLYRVTSAAAHRGRLALMITAGAIFAACGVLRQAQDDTQPPIGVQPVTDAQSLTHHRDFHYDGKRQWFKVPSGVNWIDVIVRGAAGGGTLGGRGGRVHAIIPVTPGERLAVYVGGQGENRNGGFNGGANEPAARTAPIRTLVKPEVAAAGRRTSSRLPKSFELGKAGKTRPATASSSFIGNDTIRNAF